MYHNLATDLLPIDQGKQRERKGEDSTIIKSQFLSMAYRDADINALIIFGDFIMTESPHDKHTNFVQYTYERKI